MSHSLSLTDEKFILRKIDRINHMKRKVEENNECKQKIKEKKAQIEALRLDTRNLSVQLNEIHAAFDKVNLAKRLGCSIYDLKSVTIDCHCHKIGEVIGKGGRTIQKLESETGCIIDVMNGKIRLTGLISAIERCSVLIERILLDTEDSILLCRSMHGYLIGNVSNLLFVSSEECQHIFNFYFSTANESVQRYAKQAS
jgi:transcription antitermination factor NusA-like protein